MRKLMIAMLALAVVFGFAACDNSTANSGAASQLDVAYIEAVEKTATDYLVGETADPADFTFTGYDAAGNVVIEDMASTLFSATKSFVKGDDEAVFTYNGTVKVPSIKVPVSVYEVEKLTVDATADDVQKTYYTVVETKGNGTVNVDSMGETGKYASFAKVNKTGLVVTATYDGGKTKEIAADDYKATLQFYDADGVSDKYSDVVWSTVNTVATGDKFVVTISMDGVSSTDEYEVKFETNAISEIYFDIDSKLAFYYAEDGVPADADIPAGLNTDGKVVILAKMVNGQEGYKPTQAKALIGLTAADAATSTINVTTLNTLPLTSVANSADSITLYAVYTGTDVVTGYKKTAVPSRAIDLVENVPVGIEVDVKTFKIKLDTNYGTGSTETIANTALAVNYKLADGSPGAALAFNETAENDGFTISETRYSSNDYAAGVKVDVTITPVAHPEWAKTVAIETE